MLDGPWRTRRGRRWCVIAAWPARRAPTVEYLIERSDGERRWGPRPRAGMTRGLGRRCTAMGAEVDRRTVRTRIKASQGAGWLWLATEAPQAMCRRSAAAMVERAESKGVRTPRVACMHDGGMAVEVAAERADAVAKMGRVRAESARAGVSRAGRCERAEAATSHMASAV